MAGKSSKSVKPEDATLANDAASTVQRAWRTHRANLLSPQSRWHDAFEHARFQAQRNAADDGHNDPKSRWKRAVRLASKLQEGNMAEYTDDSVTPGDVDEENVKILETQHWLELTDSKHRYGSNLKYYHARWKNAPTTDNFFKWLDRGDGKDLSLPECPRDKLESERIVYLSAQQRLNYLVEIDDKGRLCWARSNELVDTRDTEWQDAGDGSGIVPSDDTYQKAPIARRTSFEAGPSYDIVSDATDPFYKTEESGSKTSKWFHKNFTPTGLAERFIKKTIRRNTWIYVADKRLRLYIGIKDTGAFQHSSFLAGGQVVSAGLISVHDGVIHKLSPLSGHYRTDIDNFNKFVSMMKDKGVDMHKAEINKGKFMLLGVNRINKAKKTRKALSQTEHEQLSALKDKIPTRIHMSYPSDWGLGVLTGRRKHDNESFKESAGDRDEHQ